jgi:hypothetical protein
MKKAAVVFAVLVLVVIMIGANMRKNTVTAGSAIKKKPCYGYTIIEFGKGINCNGDTIKLEKVRGGQELARTIKANTNTTLAIR